MKHTMQIPHSKWHSIKYNILNCSDVIRLDSNPHWISLYFSLRVLGTLSIKHMGFGSYVNGNQILTHVSIRNKAHYKWIDLMKELNAMNVVEHIKNSYSRNRLPKRLIRFFPTCVVQGDLWWMVYGRYMKILIMPRCFTLHFSMRSSL